MSTSDAPLRLGGRYLLVRELGRGGMACVYLARDERLGRDVAIKRLLPGSLDPSLARRLEREARLAASVSHPSAVAVHDFGEDEGMPYLVTEYVEGETLHAFAARRRRRFAEIAALWLHPVARALGAAHARGLVHRDVKPANVLVSRAGEVKLADFGIALAKAATSRFTADGMVTGSLSYLAPERIDGREADAASDVFAVGVSWYELATGVLPFTGDSPAAMAAAVLTGRYEPLGKRCPSAPPALETLCHRCLASDPGQRPADGAALARLLEAALAEEGLAHSAAELPSYFSTPDGYEAALAERQGGRCASLAREASNRGDLAQAARLATRAAAYQPELPISDLLTPPLPRSRWGLAAGALLAAVAGTLVAWQVRRPVATQAADATPSSTPTPTPANARSPLPPLPSPVTDAHPVKTSAPHPTRQPKPEAQAPAGPPAHVRLTTEPWARVFVDGQAVGYTPTVHELSLPPGKHALRLENPYCHPREESLTLAAGESKTLDLALDALAKP